jgi:hypothetical protein
VNRASLSFAAFVLLLAAALLFMAWQLGPGQLAFLFHPERHTAPFVMVNLLVPVEGEDADAMLLEMLERLGGDPRWVATTERVVEGGNADFWPMIAFIEHPSRAHFTDQLGLREFRQLTGISRDRLVTSAVLAAELGQPLEPGAAQAFALRLMAAADPDAHADYDEQWFAQDASLLERHGGRVLWRARVDPLSVPDHARFDELMVLGFATVRERDRWLDDTGRATAAVLQSRLWRRNVVLAVAPLAVPILDAEAPATAPFPDETPLRPPRAQDSEDDAERRSAPDQERDGAASGRDGDQGGSAAPDDQTRTVPNSSNSPRFGNVSAASSATGA